MKRYFLVLIGLLVLGGTAQAKTKQKSASTQDLPMQTMNMPACNMNMGANCPMMDAMPVMIQVMKLQQRLDEGVSGAERKELLEDKAKLIAVLDASSAQMKSMPCMSGQMPCMQPGMKSQMPCAPGKTPPCVPAPKK